MLMDYRVLIIIFIEELFAIFLLRKSGIIRSLKSLLICSFLIVAAFSIRLYFFNYETTDYQWFLTKWVDFYRNNNGFRGLRFSNGNYNIPYLYFMALFSYSEIKDLFLIKLLSCFFDVILAYAAMLCIRNSGETLKRSAIGFFVVLFLPTVIVNSSVWAQCDSIYVSLALLGIALALPDDERCHPVLSMICIAASFGFKLQAVFIMPVYIILWIVKRFRWQHFLLFPATYLAMILPAVILGRPLSDCITLYADQADTVGSSLNYNAPSIFGLLKNITDTESASKAGIIFAFAAMTVIIAVAFIFRNRLGRKGILCLSLLMVCIIPFLLPHMHDRYFFAADILSVVLAVAFPRAIPCALLTQFASGICYIAYLTGYYQRIGKTLLTTDKGATALIFSMLICIVCLTHEITQNKKKIS